ncbi:T7SS effector LXG polymorphic toxin [Sutcliffiella horikoshii]
MMKVLDVSSLHEGIRGMTQQLSQLEKQLNGVENSIRSFVASKDSFRGQGASAIRRFYEYAHLPFLEFFQTFLVNFQSKLQQLQFEMDGLEGNSQGFIDESFLTSELEDGLNQINRMVAELAGETNAQLSRVSDIVYLPQLQDCQFHEGIQQAKQSARQTVDKLHQFDHQQTQSFTALSDDLTLINRYIEEMNQQFESGKINVKSFSPVMLQDLETYGELQTRLYNQTVMQRWNSQHYPELGVFYPVGHAASFDKWVNPSCARPEPKGVVESGIDFTKGLFKGGFAVVKETVEFAGRVLTEPEEVLIETIDFVAAVKDDPKILLEITQSLVDSFNDQVIYGTAETRGEWFGYALASVAGGKGITSIPKIAKAGKLGKLGGGPGRQMQHKVQLMIESQKAKLENFSTSVKGTIKTQQAAIKGAATALKTTGINKVRELMKDFLPPKNKSQLSLAGGPYNTIDSANINRKLEEFKNKTLNRIEVEGGNYNQHFTKIKGKKVLKPNIEYKTKEGYHYKTDSDGRISNVEATLQLGKADRNNYAQRIVGGVDRLPNDDGGHLIASIFKGSGEIDNLVPMNSTLNRKEYKLLENSWKKALNEGKTVEVNIEPIYKGNSSRPAKFEVEYKINGKKYEVNLINYDGGS